MFPNKRLIGNVSEEIAVKYLIRNNFRIIERNCYLKSGEIDIVCFDLNARQLVFVEVKSLQDERYISVLQTISQAKKHKIITSCIYWLEKHAKINNDWRIDFIGIVLDNSSVVHLQAAIY